MLLFLFSPPPPPLIFDLQVKLLFFQIKDKHGATYLNAGFGEIQAHCELFSKKMK